MRVLIFFTLIELFFFQLTFAQNLDQVLVKVIDSKTLEPIPFATVRIKDSSLGVIADYNGEFRMPLRYKDDLIIISCIGYKAKEVPLNQLNFNELNTIKISPQVEALNPVFISSRTKINGINFNAKSLVKASRKLSAKEIVLRAINRIPNNLSDKPHSYIGYYRDYQLVDNKFHNLNEAILETFDNGINTSFLEENTVSTAIYSFNQNQNFIIDSSLTKAYNGVTKYIKNAQILPRGGNEHTLLNIHNPIRNYNFSTFSYVYKFESDFPRLHEFRKDDIVFLNNEPLILINFKKANPHDFSVYGLKTAINKDEYVRGSIYISLVDYSIHRFNYKVYMPGSKKALFNVSLEYARQDNKMYLNYITFNNSFAMGEDFNLREEKVQFDKSEQAFYITFNNTKDYLDFNTMSTKNFKFKLGKKNLKTIAVDKVTERVIKVTVENFDGSLVDINANNVNDLTYKLRRIRDVTGREIYGENTIEGDQFREFFVQKVNVNKPMPSELDLMDKNSLINESALNDFEEANQYWINTPLMNEKGQN
ncbi:carboxypeptidase-like regulatory domain-containing protein [Winogradskyella sp.]|uniref:carboxypeptidase-like regulatory domain-containing protein n=1 Tax=Winogradskyella sp. TaxID=1883156 RepID=UPI0026121791|nr:carboxypeptidase-like regulatory domain-containing protein [Winogradskyella sp.]